MLGSGGNLVTPMGLSHPSRPEAPLTRESVVIHQTESGSYVVSDALTLLRNLIKNLLFLQQDVSCYQVAGGRAATVAASIVHRSRHGGANGRGSD